MAWHSSLSDEIEEMFAVREGVFDVWHPVDGFSVVDPEAQAAARAEYRRSPEAKRDRRKYAVSEAGRANHRAAQARYLAKKAKAQ